MLLNDTDSFRAPILTLLKSKIWRFNPDLQAGVSVDHKDHSMDHRILVNGVFVVGEYSDQLCF